LQTVSLLPVVAIDGPVGVGKSSVAKQVAKIMSLRHIDTGAMYRAVALTAMKNDSPDIVNLEDLGQIAREIQIDLPPDGRVLADGQDISREIRDEKVSQYVAIVADCHAVREALVDQQRRLGQEMPSVLEGRDIGTVVFPDAALKIYLDASPQVRAQRRLDQLEAMGMPADMDEILARLIERDQRDRNRPWGALSLAKDARLVDTTAMSEKLVVDLLCSLVHESPQFAQETKVGS
jgi:CMP/dCMP kinase